MRSDIRFRVEKGGKFLRAIPAVSPHPPRAIHFACCSRAAECAAMIGGKVVTIAIEHPGACRDLGDLIDTHVVSIELV